MGDQLALELHRKLFGYEPTPEDDYIDTDACDAIRVTLDKARAEARAPLESALTGWKSVAARWRELARERGALLRSIKGNLKMLGIALENAVPEGEPEPDDLAGVELVGEDPASVKGEEGYALTRALELRDQAVAVCERRTQERDEALAELEKLRKLCRDIMDQNVDVGGSVVQARYVTASRILEESER